MATYEQAAMFHANQREANLRELLRREYGKGQYRIARSGKEIHAYGPIPNTIYTGWYFVGWRSDVEQDYGL